MITIKGFPAHREALVFLKISLAFNYFFLLLMISLRKWGSYQLICRHFSGVGKY